MAFGNTFAVVGGTESSFDTGDTKQLDTVYLRGFDGQWNLLSNRLTEGRSYVVAFPVDRSKFPTC